MESQWVDRDETHHFAYGAVEMTSDPTRKGGARAVDTCAGGMWEWRRMKRRTTRPLQAHGSILSSWGQAGDGCPQRCPWVKHTSSLTRRAWSRGLS